MRAAIVLAAGRSRRFVGGNKLLARNAGQAILARAVAAARAAPVARVLVVVGHDRARTARVAGGPRTRIIVARAHRSGVSASLRAALAALWPIERELFVFLGDMPDVPRSLPPRLARFLGRGWQAVRPRGATGPGHPVLLRRPGADAITRLRGDSGMAGLIAGNVRWVEMGKRQAADVDTRHDLAALRRKRLK